jgi:histidinol phosphatase-like PHP family hydrolase
MYGVGEVVDLHTHSLFSDGELGPAELRRRAEVKGYRAFAITDHVDSSNCDSIVPKIVRFSVDSARLGGVKIVPGAELTHCRPSEIPALVKRVRELGAKVVVVHGETAAEPVEPGTNRAAIEAGADVLAHPGCISEEDAKLASQRGVMLEVSGHKGHSITNGRVVAQALRAGARLVFGSDAHAPEELMTLDFVRRAVLGGAGMDDDAIDRAIRDAELLLELCQEEELS